MKRFYTAFRQIVIPLSMLMGFSIGLSVCWTTQASAGTGPTFAVLPFVLVKTEDSARGAICPVCQDVYQQGTIHYGSQKILTRLLQQQMETKEDFQLLAMEKVEEAYSKRDQVQFELNPKRSAVQLGKALKADYVFAGFIFRFQERVGSALGVEKPASVGFDIHLIRIQDGKVVWTGRFDKTQKSLSENLFEIGTFVKGKGTWVTAEELSKIGMEEMLKKLPEPKVLEAMP